MSLENWGSESPNQKEASSVVDREDIEALS
jgi:hypothetical protein